MVVSRDQETGPWETTRASFRDRYLLDALLGEVGVADRASSRGCLQDAARAHGHDPSSRTLLDEIHTALAGRRANGRSRTSPTIG